MSDRLVTMFPRCQIIFRGEISASFPTRLLSSLGAVDGNIYEIPTVMVT